MRPILFAMLTAGLVAIAGEGVSPAAQVPKDAPKASGKDSLATELTRTKLLKVKVSVAYIDTRVGEILKEFAHLVDTKADRPVMWAYGTDFPFAQKVVASWCDRRCSRGRSARGKGLELNAGDIQHRKTLLVPVLEDNHDRALTVERRGCQLLRGSVSGPAGCRGHYSKN